MKNTIFVLLVLISACAQPTAQDTNLVKEMACKGSAECFEAVVTRIVDGDTIDVEDELGEERIRLALVDAPEKDTVDGEKATAFVSNFCPIGSRVLIDQDDRQLYSGDRMLAIVWCNKERLNEEIISEGYANIYYEFCNTSEFGKERWAVKYGC